MEEFYERQEILVTKLLSSYRKEIPPIYTRGRYNQSLANPLLVTLSLSYLKVITINELEQTMTLILEYDLYWNDPRLRWNPSEYHEIDGFLVNRDALWRPDVLPYDAQSISDARDLEVQHVYVKSDGDMRFYASRVVTIVCRMKVQRFPFDQQVCEVGFYSSNTFSREIHLLATVHPLINISGAGTGEWSIGNVTGGDTFLMVPDSPESYEMVYFDIRVIRSSIFYIVLIVVPSFVLTILCVLGLFWTKFNKTDYLEKLALGFAAILAMCAVLEIAGESVPRTRQLPALSIFIMVNLLLLATAICIVVIGSKSCDFTSAAKLTQLSKKYITTTGVRLFRNFRVICLIVFPILTIGNLLILLLG